MKHLTIFIVLLTLVSLCRGQTNHQQSPKENLKFSDCNCPFAIDSLPGYTLCTDGESIDVLKAGNTVFTAFAESMDPYDLAWAKRLDSLDIGKGLVFARGLTGAAVEDGQGGTKYFIDSSYEYRNRFNARCFHLWIRSLSYDDNDSCYISHYEGYFVDMSRGKTYGVIQIPNTLDFLENKALSELYLLLANSIKIKP